MNRLTRTLGVGAVLLAICGATVFAAVASASASSKGKKTSGVVYAALVHTVGKTEYAAGLVSDKVLGKGAVEFALTVGEGTKAGSLKGKGSVTVFTSTGQLQGTDSVTINTTSAGVTFTGGKLDLTKGQGLQKGHSFVGTFTGTAKSIAGPYTFNDKGTYK
jgi:hypothetical protein